MLSRLMPSTEPILSTLAATNPPTRPPTMPRTIIISRPSREPMIWLARKPAIAPTTIQEMKPIEPFLPCRAAPLRPTLSADEALPAWGPRRGHTIVSGRLAPEDPHGPDHDQLDDRPANEGHDGRDIEHRTRGMEGVRPEDPLERRDEQLADVQDARHEVVGFSGVEQEQDEARSNDELDQPEHEDDDASGHLGRPGARPGDATTVRPHRLLTRVRPRWFLTRGHRGFPGDACPIGLIDGHGFLLCAMGPRPSSPRDRPMKARAGSCRMVQRVRFVRSDRRLTTTTEARSKIPTRITGVGLDPGTSVVATASVAGGVSEALGAAASVAVGVSEGLAVGVGEGLAVGVGEGVGVGVEHVDLVIVSLIKVTLPFRASARPSTVTPLFIVMDVRARMVPAKLEPDPSVAELVTCQKTLQG